MQITQAAREGDPLGLAVMENFGTWLGQGLSIVADVLDRIRWRINRRLECIQAQLVDAHRAGQRMLLNLGQRFLHRDGTGWLGLR